MKSRKDITFFIRQFSLRDYYHFLEGTKGVLQRDSMDC